MSRVYLKRPFAVRYVLLATMSLCLLSTAVRAEDAAIEVETVAEGLNFPWCVAFLPGGDFLVTEKSGTLRRIDAEGEIGDPLAGVPETYYASQGGLFDVLLDPDFASNRTLYLSFAHGTPEANGTRVVRARLGEGGLEDVEPIFTVSPLKDTPVHYGGKLAFLGDGTLLLTTGDGFNYREAAMDPFSQLGKTIRINTDGSIPTDNPFADGEQANPAVYTLGHRNPQGLVVDASTDRVWLHEHGAQGGDELNLLKAGANYGWPATTHGVNYSGAYVSPFKTAPGIEPPVIHWTPSIAPSGLALYDGDAFPDWRGDLFVGALVDQDVKHLEVSGTRVSAQNAMVKEIGARIRDVRTGPDGFLYLLTDAAEGRLIRVRPAR